MKANRRECAPGDVVRVRTRFGWDLVGVLGPADPSGVRIYDSAVEEVVRLDHNDVEELTLQKEAPVKQPD